MLGRILCRTHQRSNRGMLASFSSSASGASNTDPKMEFFHNDEKLQEIMFKNESNSSILMKYLVYQMTRFPFFIENCRKITEMTTKLVGKNLIYYIVDKTVGRVFSAGKSLDELERESGDLLFKGVHTIADLSIEGVMSGSKDQLDANRDQIVNTLRVIANDTKMERKVINTGCFIHFAKCR